MPVYRIERREVVAGTTPADWIAAATVDTGGSTPSSQAPRVETITGLTNGQEYEFRVVRLDNGTPAAATTERRARPSRFDIDYTDAYTGGVTLNWTDQRGGKHYRVDRWVTATDTPDPSDVESTPVELAGSVNYAGQTQITGLSNGTLYRFRVHRLQGSNGSIARSTSIGQATPTTEFDAPAAGFTALGPSVVNGDLKAQFAVDSMGQSGILITLKGQNFESLTVSYVQGVTTSNVSVTGGNKVGSTKSYFVAIANLTTSPISVPNSSPVKTGARVVLVAKGTTSTTEVEPTYVP
jgi:hypothetical protein